MTKLCFIGNSHLAAIKLGWDQVSQLYPDLDVSFFGAAGATMEFLAPEGDLLKATDERLSSKLEALWGRTELRPDDFDLICVHGMGGGIRTLQPLYPAFRSDEHKNTEGVFRRLSTASFAAAALGLVQATLAGRTCHRIQATTQRPIYFVEQPALSARARTEERGAWVNAAVASGDGDALVALFRSCLLQLPGVRQVVPQPAETKATALSTKPEYSAGSVKLKDNVAEEHEEGDNLHMNALYGAAVFAELASLLSCPTRGAAKA